jgi:hypothetical protein
VVLTALQGRDAAALRVRERTVLVAVGTAVRHQMRFGDPDGA